MTRAQRKAIRQLFCSASLAPGKGDTMLSIDDIESWPIDTVPNLTTAKLIEETVSARTIICPGCDERCLRPIELVDQGGANSAHAVSTCDLFDGRGPFYHPAETLAAWATSRKMITNFISRQLSLKRMESDALYRRTRFQPFHAESVQRTVSLEFSARPLVNIGDAKVRLESLMLWDDHGIRLDQQLFMDCMRQSGQQMSGNKEYQASRSVQEDKKLGTQLRNRRLQRRLDQLAREHGNLNKEQLVRKIAKEDEFSNTSEATILRNTHMPERRR